MIFDSKKKKLKWFTRLKPQNEQRWKLKKEKEVSVCEMEIK